jgi:3-hydroxyisobutyrate dehydrogenase-like beta-hydroxyacid dehydrogenase
MGLDPAAFSPSRAIQRRIRSDDIKGRKMVLGDFAPQGFVAQSLKDFSLMAEQAQHIGQRLPLAETYTALMRGCVAQGEGELDNAAVINEIRRRRTEA